MSQTQICRGVATTVKTDKAADAGSVIYHATEVVKWDKWGIVLDSGGWRTKTTKLHMNQASNQYNLGFQVYQKKGEWFVSFRSGEKMHFFDGMRLQRAVFSTTNDIRDDMENVGSHWWEPDTMRFFQSRVGTPLYQGDGGIFFVSSEKSPFGTSRAYTVRRYDPDTRDISTVGDFCSIATRGIAHREAASLAKG